MGFSDKDFGVRIRAKWARVTIELSAAACSCTASVASLWHGLECGTLLRASEDVN